MAIILQWIDIIWLPLAWLAVHRPQRIYAVACVFSCMIMMRLMAELMEFIGYPNGLLGFMSTSVLARGLGVYSLFYMGYILFAHFSPGRTGALFLGVSVSVFFASALVYVFVMVL